MAKKLIGYLRADTEEDLANAIMKQLEEAGVFDDREEDEDGEE